MGRMSEVWSIEVHILYKKDHEKYHDMSMLTFKKNTPWKFRA